MNNIEKQSIRIVEFNKRNLIFSTTDYIAIKFLKRKIFYQIQRINFIEKITK